MPHLDAAYNLARWLTRDPVEAEDIVYDACVRAFQYFMTNRHASDRAGLLKTVRDAAYARLKAKTTTVEAVLGSADQANGDSGVGADAGNSGLGPDATFGVTQDPAQLTAAVASLPIDLRECLILRETEALSYKEIARITEVSIDTVTSRLFRARYLLMASWTACKSENLYS
jgi:RNA polymerase sigma-70 factor (ECF subfamily)